MHLNDHKYIVTQAYTRGLRMGLLSATLLLATIISFLLYRAHTRLMDEVKSTNYYYSLTQTQK